MLHEAGLTRIVGSGACLTRNPALKSQVQVWRQSVQFFVVAFYLFPHQSTSRDK
jgi:hypothetical protein